MNRRTFLAAAALSAVPLPARSQRYRAAVIGHTGRGNYGHGLDTVWKSFDFIDLVAVADPDPAGLAKGRQETGAAKGYADYREMLRVEKPDLVSIGPRHMDQRVAMVEAACEAGCHIYCEKAFASNLADADRMVRAVRSAGVKLQLAHQMRRSPFLLKVVEMVRAGEIGDVQEVRGRGKEDKRAGGEDLMVLGSHILDVIRALLGDPGWVYSHVTDKGAEMSREHVRRPTEPIGPVAGREIAAIFGFPGGVHGYFASKASDQTHPLRFGTWIYGSRGVIYLPNAIYPDGQPWILRTPSWLPDEKVQWTPIEAAAPTGVTAEGRDLANALMALDLIEAIEQDRKPACSEVDGLWSAEMIVGIYQSQSAGKPLPFPLADRGSHPLESL